MIESENLKYFINEEIFLVKERQLPEKPENKNSDTETKAPEPVVAAEQEAKYDQEFHDVIVWTGTLTTEDQELLTKMLGAINLDPTNIHHIKEDNHFTDQFNSLLYFGNVTQLIKTLKKEIPFNKIVSIGDKKILASYALNELHGDNQKKMVLWNNLKALFIS